MSDKDRERILAAMELALGFPARDEKILSPQDPDASVQWVDESQPWAPVQKELEGLSARFHSSSNAEQARKVVDALLQEHGVKKAVIWDHPLLSSLGISDLLRDRGVEVIDPERSPYFARESATADLGITAADGLLVESGALLVRAGRGRERSSSLLPPVHLAVVSAEQRLESVNDLVPLWRQWIREEGRLPSGIHLITGPSRTADIELTLVLGAHGPKVLHVLALQAECAAPAP
jgi:L-lactate dehydrogenase complex protein LldG